MMRLKSITGIIIAGLLCACTTTISQPPLDHYDGPIIDVHLHAFKEAPPFSLCLPWIKQFPVWDQREDWGTQGLEPMLNPSCDDPIPPEFPEDDALLNATLAALEEHNVFGIVSGAPDEARRWHDASPDRLMPSLEFRIDRDRYTVEEMRALLNTGDFFAVGEISNQYGGIAPDDERMMPFWALAEELDIPVAIHVGEGAVGTAYFGLDSMSKYRAQLSNPMLLEEVLVQHPKLRISVMHYGAPFVTEMIALMASHPQVHVDIGGMQWFYPKPFFYQHLEAMIDAGFEKRIMFGSDQGEWPGVIGPSIEIINDAPFLSAEQKADIFYYNAARFFRFSDKQIYAHWATARNDRDGSTEIASIAQ